MFQLSLSTSLTPPTAPGAGTNPAPSGAFSLALADALGPIVAPDGGGGTIVLPESTRQAPAGDGKPLPAGAATAPGAADATLAWLDLATVPVSAAGAGSSDRPAAAAPSSAPVAGEMPAGRATIGGGYKASASSAAAIAVADAATQLPPGTTIPTMAATPAAPAATGQTAAPKVDDETASPESRNARSADDDAGTTPSIAPPAPTVTTIPIVAADASSDTPVAGSRHERDRQTAQNQQAPATDGLDVSAAAIAVAVAMVAPATATPDRPSTVQPTESASAPILVDSAMTASGASVVADHAPPSQAAPTTPQAGAGSPPAMDAQIVAALDTTPRVPAQPNPAASSARVDATPTTAATVATGTAPPTLAAVVQGIMTAGTMTPPPTVAVDGPASDTGAPPSTPSISAAAISTSPIPANQQGTGGVAASPQPAAAPTPAVAQPAGIVFGIALGAAVAADQRAAASDKTSPRDEALQALTAAAGSTQPLVMPAALDGTPQGTLDMRRDDWPQAMIDRIEALRDAADAQDTSIRLVPDALGRVDVSIRHDGDAVHVHFAAEVPATRQMIADAQPRLADAAQARGLRLSQTAVDAGSTSANQQHQQGGALPQPRSPIRPAFVPATAASDDAAAPDSTRLA